MFLWSFFMIETDIRRTMELHGHEIVFGYLFGSQAKGLADESSDIDIAIFVTPESKDASFDIKIELYMNLSRILKRNNIDIVILNQCKNLILMNEIISHGHLICDTDKSLRQLFEQRILHSAIDFKTQRRMTMGI